MKMKKVTSLLAMTATTPQVYEEMIANIEEENRR